MKRLSLALMTLLACGAAHAASEEVEMHMVTPQSVGQSIGKVTISETDNGLKFTPDLRALPPGERGFHVHAKGSCDPGMKNGKPSAAEAAGGHLDPHDTAKHLGPRAEGHLGDLPVLVVNKEGKATEPVTAERLKKLDEVKGKALMIHVGGDNYSDQPEPLGGGGARFACGVIK